MATEWWNQDYQLLRKVRRGLADLDLSRDLLQERITALEQEEAKLAVQAVKARQLGREDLGRIALARQREAGEHRGELAVQLDQVLAEEAKLASAARRLQARQVIRRIGLDDTTP